MARDDDADSNPQSPKRPRTERPVYIDICNYDALRYMYKHWEAISDLKGEKSRDTKRFLKCFLADATVDEHTHIASLEVIYDESWPGSRLYAHTAKRNLWASFASMHRTCRHTMSYDRHGRPLYQDMDIKNAMKVLVCQWSIAQQLDVPTLQRYVEQRDTMLKELMDACNLDRDGAKALVCSIMTHGTKWRFKRNLPQWCLDLADDAAVIVAHVKENHPDLLSTAEYAHSRRDKKWENLDGTIMGVLYQTIEARCLAAMEEN
jgi:hypothetical protein